MRNYAGNSPDSILGILDSDYIRDIRRVDTLLRSHGLNSATLPSGNAQLVHQSLGPQFCVNSPTVGIVIFLGLLTSVFIGVTGNDLHVRGRLQRLAPPIGIDPSIAGVGHAMLRVVVEMVFAKHVAYEPSRLRDLSWLLRGSGIGW